MVKLRAPYLVIPTLLIIHAISKYNRFDTCAGIPIPKFPITFGKIYLLSTLIFGFLFLRLLPKPKFSGPEYPASVKYQDEIPIKSIVAMVVLPLPLLLIFVYTLIMGNTCFSYDYILIFSIVFIAYLLVFAFAVIFIQKELKQAEEEHRRNTYIRDEDLHDGKMNVYKRIVEDKYFDYARYLKMQDKMMSNRGYTNDRKRPLGNEEIEGLKIYCLEKSSSS